MVFAALFGWQFALNHDSSYSSGLLPTLNGPNPEIPGILPSSTGRMKLIMGADIDYPPYAYLPPPPYGDKSQSETVQGVGPDMINAMAEHCGFDVEVVQAHWSDCWGTGEIGQGLLKGWYHGCMTYTHAAGQRNRFMEFTNSWAMLNKPSGLITKLVNGKPKLNGMDTLNGKRILDVTGWAPTADTLNFVKNQCTDSKYTDFTIVHSESLTVQLSVKGENDKAIHALLEDQVDAVWIYADQAYNYKCQTGDNPSGWDCSLWDGFGRDFAYVQVGMYGWMNNGTTVAMSRKGSGIADFLDKCLDDFMTTTKFYDVCKTNHGSPPHNQINTCIPNQYIRADPEFKPFQPVDHPWLFSTKEVSETMHSCATGYCKCSE